jgi:type I restriction enzyme, R subunit
LEDQPAYGVTPHEQTDHLERVESQLSALRLLMQLGWDYLTPEEADQLRGGQLDCALLEPVLADHIRAHGRFYFKGATHRFTENAIQSAVQDLKKLQIAGNARRSEQAYDLLCLGTSASQTIEGATKSFTIDYIDWQSPANNAFHCTSDFKVERADTQKYAIPGIVLFVNGIPLAVASCKYTDHTLSRQASLDRAIDRLSVFQARGGIPQLFMFSQLLLALARGKARYGTTGTPRRYWAAWKESGLDGDLRRIMDAPGQDKAEVKLISPLSGDRFATAPLQTSRSRELSEQDRTLYALCRPERLLELVFKFVLFDDGTRKIARYHQYFTVQAILRRVLSAGEGEPHPGGVVWQTHGSGKSLTMIMLAKSLALHPALSNPKIILVTDRFDPKDQICGTFRSCGLALERAATGRQLVAFLSDPRTRVVITQLHKVAAAAANRDLKAVDRNTFVLMDEDHCYQYREQYDRICITFAGACFIAFSGTPLAMNAKESTIARFGDLIQPAYTIGRAVADKAVMPLLYEARHVPRVTDRRAVDSWFEKLTAGLADDRKADLKRKLFTEPRLSRDLEKVHLIAWDVGIHYASVYQHTGRKGQLVAPDKETALRYKSFLDGFGRVASEVLISAPGTREGDDRLNGPTPEENNFWQAMMDRFGSEKNYNKQLINAFKHGNHPEIIIVVDKLLTGFDAPCNAVLYLARKLKEHTLLQAIARVNRLHPVKAYGLILDYSGAIQDQAIDFYGQLTAYDPADLKDTVTNVRERTGQLPQLHTDVWELFSTIKDIRDPEGYASILQDEALKNRFCDRFDRFANTLVLALSSTSFLMDTPEKTVRQYRDDLKFFQSLMTVARRPEPVCSDISREPAGRDTARLYYGCVSETMPSYGPVASELTARIAARIYERLRRHKIRDWRTNPDAINRMRGEIDDILFDAAEELGIDISLEEQDAIIDRCIQTAIANED